MTKSKYIYRVDRERAHYWVVRLKLNGKFITKTFSDSRYGGNDAAHAAAHQWLEDFKNSYNFVPPRKIRKVTSRNNTSGVNGVHRGARNGRDFWATRFYATRHKIKERVFWVDIYGEDGAFQMAVKKRQEMEAFYAMDRTAFEAMYNAKKKGGN